MIMTLTIYRGVAKRGYTCCQNRVYLLPREDIPIAKTGYTYYQNRVYLLPEGVYMLPKKSIQGPQKHKYLVFDENRQRYSDMCKSKVYR